MTRFDGIERQQYRGHQKLQVGKAVRSGTENDDRNPSATEILLIRDFLIGSYQDFEICGFSSTKQRAIFQACQLGVRRRLAIMFAEREPKLLVNTLIQGASNSGETEFFTLLEKLDGKIPGDRREPFQEFIERVTVLDVVKQRLHGNTGTAKNRCPMHHFRIACNDFSHIFIVAQSVAVRLVSLLFGEFCGPTKREGPILGRDHAQSIGDVRLDLTICIPRIFHR